MTFRPWDWLAAVLADRGIPNGATRVAAALACRAASSGECFPTQFTIAGDCCLTERGVRIGIRSLQKSGYVVAVPYRDKGQAWRRNRYRLTFPKVRNDGSSRLSETSGTTVPHVKRKVRNRTTKGEEQNDQRCGTGVPINSKVTPKELIAEEPNLTVRHGAISESKSTEGETVEQVALLPESEGQSRATDETPRQANGKRAGDAQGWKSALWTAAKEKIGGSDPGAFVAKLAKQYGEQAVVAAVAATLAWNPADFKSGLAKKAAELSTRKVRAKPTVADPFAGLPKTIQ